MVDNAAIAITGAPAILKDTRAQILSGVVDAAAIQWVIAASAEVKPRRDYDRDSRTIRHNYNGDQEGRLRAVLARRYPRTSWRMPITPQNITAETAELDAQVYRQQPERWLEIDGARATGGAADAYDALIARAGLDVTMPELERVACLLRTAFVRMRATTERAALGEPVGVEGLVLWGHQVHAVVSSENPADIGLAPVVMLQLAGEGTDLALLPPVYEVWTRTTDGKVAVARYDEHGRVLAARREVAAPRSPIVAAPIRPSTSIFPPPERDLLHVQDQVNVTLADHHHRFGLQAHRQIVMSGVSDQKAGRELVLAPDTILTVPDQSATVTALEANDSVSAFEGVERTLVLHGRGRRQPIEAWHTKGGNPESGESRRIKNEWADQKRAEHVAMMRAMEPRLQRAIVDVAAAAGIYDVPPGQLSFGVRFAPPPTYESETTRLDRALKMQGAGWVSPAQAAVVAGAYSSLEAAVAAGLSTSVGGDRPAGGGAAPEQPADSDDHDTRDT